MALQLVGTDEVGVTWGRGRGGRRRTRSVVEDSSLRGRALGGAGKRSELLRRGGWYGTEEDAPKHQPMAASPGEVTAVMSFTSEITITGEICRLI